MNAALKTLRDSEGRLFTLENLRDEDDDGVVSSLAGEPTLEARIFRILPDASAQFRLKAMVLGSDEALAEVALWPNGLLYNDRDEVTGYLMPVRTGLGTLADLLDVERSKRLFPQGDYAFRVKVARHLAMSVQVIHEHDHVLGYVDPAAIDVLADGSIRWLHGHRFQIHAWNKVFPARRGPSVYWPPELQGDDTAQARTRDQDHFALAVLVYQVLMMGEHPFASVRADGSSPTLETAIAAYAYVHDEDAAQNGIAPLPGSLPVNLLSMDLHNAFSLTFAPLVGVDCRPRAEGWAEWLRRFGKSLQTCAGAAYHQYREGLPACPWCERLSRDRISYFQPDDVILNPPPDNTPAWEPLAQAIAGLKSLPPVTVIEPSVRVTGRPLVLAAEQHPTLAGRLWHQVFKMILEWVFRFSPATRRSVFKEDLALRQQQCEQAKQLMQSARESFAQSPEEQAFQSACDDALAICGAFSSAGSIIIDGDAQVMRRRGLQAQLERLSVEREQVLQGREAREAAFRTAWKSWKQAEADLAVF